MISEVRRASSAGNEAEQPRHICLFHQGDTEHFATISKFLQQGIEHSERALYIYDDHGVDDPLSSLLYMEEYGLDVDRVEFVSSSETYLQGGYFSAERMLDFIADALLQTRRRGYRGLRATGEMTWCLQRLPGCDTIATYEAAIDKHFEQSPLVAVCQYDISRIPFDVLIKIALVHHGFIGQVDLADAIVSAIAALNKPKESLDRRFKDMHASEQQLQDLLLSLLSRQPFVSPALRTGKDASGVA